MSKTLRLSVALVIFIAVLLWVDHEIGWMKVWQSWQQVDYVSLALLTLLTFTSYLLRAYRIYHLFSEKIHPFFSYLYIHLIHNALNNFLPMRLGEASFPLLMKHHFRTPIMNSSGGLFWLRLVDLHWLISCFLLIACFEFSPFVLIALLLWFMLPITLYFSPEKWLNTLPALLRNNWEQIAKNIPKHVSQVIHIYIQTILIWSIKLLALTIVFLSFLQIPFFQGFLAITVADLSSVLPIHGFAGTGTYEAAIIAATTPFTPYNDQVLLAAINVHIYLLLVTALSVPIAFLLPTHVNTKH